MTEIGKDVALERSNQSALNKAVKKFKKGKGKFRKNNDEETTGLGHKRGIIVLKHIPHGFFEDEIKGYFSQFGKVLRVRVARSLKTGKSRGYAYVEFEFEEVAKIAAESMNNYLMFERLIKCELLPPTVNRRKLFKNSYIREDKNPKVMARKKQLAEQDRVLTPEEENDILQQRRNKLKEQNKRLAELGINYSFKLTEPAAKKSKIQEVEINAKSPSTSIKTPKKISEISVKILKGSPNVSVKTPKRTSELLAKTPKRTPEVSMKTPKRASETPVKTPKGTPNVSVKTPKRTSELLAKTPKKTPEVSIKTPKRASETPVKTPKGTSEVSTKTPKKTPEVSMKSPKKTPDVSKTLKRTSEISVKSPKSPVQTMDKQKTPKKKSLDKLTAQQLPSPSIESNMKMTTNTPKKSPKSEAKVVKTPLMEMEAETRTPKRKKSLERNSSSFASDENMKTKTPEKTKFADEKKKGKTPEQTMSSPKFLDGGKKKAKTPEQLKTSPAFVEDGKKKGKTPEKTKYSPKLLRSRKSQGPQQIQNTTPKAKKDKESVKKNNKPASPEDHSPEKVKDKMPKFSPKLLRSRKSEGPQQHTPVSTQAKKAKAKGSNAASELPRVSPKMLRSRKSEAATLTPLKDKSTPIKTKKAGRKSVF